MQDREKDSFKKPSSLADSTVGSIATEASCWRIGPIAMSTALDFLCWLPSAVDMENDSVYILEVGKRMMKDI